jgi:hypothetical protein
MATKYGKVECNEEGSRKGEIRHRQSQGSAKTGIFCADAIDYEAWVWGSRSALATASVRKAGERRPRMRALERGVPMRRRVSLNLFWIPNGLSRHV